MVQPIIENPQFAAFCGQISMDSSGMLIIEFSAHVNWFSNSMSKNKPLPLSSILREALRRLIA